MKYETKIIGDLISHIFTLSLEEIASCELSASTIKLIMELEKNPNIANQLEVLLEYFHAIEGTNRVTSLATYMKYIEAVNRPFPEDSKMGGFKSYAMPQSFTSIPTNRFTNKPVNSNPIKCTWCGHINIFNADFCNKCSATL